MSRELTTKLESGSGRSTTETSREHFPHCCAKAGAFKYGSRREPRDSFTARCKTNPNLPALLPVALSCSVCLRLPGENASRRRLYSENH